ncbi:type II CAAX endopeptidase family protein [Pseudalkalibacillus sp. SCS-8]|uniref:CPBP family intramembrane glutamic endopeptidase n=1 Tax=Pseudalkalibacillus nanhaiensis TaxID=3115291 RepID=UPI0032DA6D02
MGKRRNQRELIQSLSQRELYANLYFTQIIFLALTVILSFIFKQDVSAWLDLVSFDLNSILLWAIPTILIVVVIDVILWKKAPGKWMDDGGINERIFATISFPHLLFVSCMIGISEELLFRGILQVNLGYVPASILFAFMHIRYVYKPVLLLFVTLLSFLLGGIFLLTQNLLIPIVVHIFIDFILGLIIRYNVFSVRAKSNFQE